MTADKEKCGVEASQSTGRVVSDRLGTLALVGAVTGLARSSRWYDWTAVESSIGLDGVLSVMQIWTHRLGRAFEEASVVETTPLPHCI